MKELFGILLTTKNCACMHEMQKLHAEYTYYTGEGLFIPSWADLKSIRKKLFRYWIDIEIKNKSFSEEETAKLWREHPEIWVRIPDFWK